MGSEGRGRLGQCSQSQSALESSHQTRFLVEKNNSQSNSVQVSVLIQCQSVCNVADPNCSPGLCEAQYVRYNTVVALLAPGLCPSETWPQVVSNALYTAGMVYQ